MVAVRVKVGVAVFTVLSATGVTVVLSGIALAAVGVIAGLIGAAIGALAWFRPDLVGGGDVITQATLAGAETLAILPLIFLLRLGLGAVSYAAATPGGLFAPLLVLGAQLGLAFGLLFRLVFLGKGESSRLIQIRAGPENRLRNMADSAGMHLPVIS